MNDLQQFITAAAIQWVKDQRARLRPTTASIPADDRTVLAKYFRPGLLDATSLALSAEISDPPFYDELRAKGITDLPDFRRMIGVTFEDVIALRSSFGALDPQSRVAVLVHELAHVQQYRVLGVEEFMRIYVSSWFRERRYERIILEMHASSIEIMFLTSQAPFSAEDQLAILMKDISRYH